MKPATDIAELPDVLLLAGPAGSAAAALPMDFDPGESGAPATVLGRAAAQSRGRLVDFYELTKPRMNFLVVATTMVGYFIASPAVTGFSDAHRWALLLHTLLGTAMTAAAASVLNQYVERDYDALMPRTMNRPLPGRRVAPIEALLLGVSLGVCGMIELAFFVNNLTALLGAFTLASYVFIYTPMKRVTTLCTVIGAIPGALPPVMGVTAALGVITPAAIVLFAILFVWQMPHFLAIAILYRDDYEKGGFKMLPVVDRGLVATGLQIVLWSLALLPVSFLPVLFGISGETYFVAAVLMGIAFLGFGVLCAIRKTRCDARQLFLASILYLPCLMAAMMIDKQ